LVGYQVGSERDRFGDGDDELVAVEMNGMAGPAEVDETETTGCRETRDERNCGGGSGDAVEGKAS